LDLLDYGGNNYTKNICNLADSQGENCLEKNLGFQTRIEDLHLKGDISKGNPKINISGSTFLFRRKPVLGSKINASRPEALGVFGKIPISSGRR
jgi:hypothetical protein